MTHRIFSRNIASQRAIPTKAYIDKIKSSGPCLPVRFGKRAPGMQAGEQLDDETIEKIRLRFINMAEVTCSVASDLSEMGGAKEYVNRLLTPYVYTTGVFSSTSWNNFWSLRLADDVQPELRLLASCMYRLYVTSESKRCKLGEWHAPYLSPEELLDLNRGVISNAIRSAVRCARVSYLRQGISREDEIEKGEMLISSRHFSPFEHVAIHTRASSVPSNYHSDWCQYRKLIDDESGEHAEVKPVIPRWIHASISSVHYG